MRIRIFHIDVNKFKKHKNKNNNLKRITRLKTPYTLGIYI